jgi:hypothetical protein
MKLAQDLVQWRALVLAVNNLRVLLQSLIKIGSIFPHFLVSNVWSHGEVYNLSIN